MVAARFRNPVALRVESLTLARGERLLFERLSFVAAPGDYVTLRGPNGSGKTSLLRAIAGFLRPQAGRIAFEGAEEAVEALHFVGHLNGLKGAATAAAHIFYWAGLFGAADTDAKIVLDGVGLASQAHLPARVLSQGQARRLALARLLVAPRPVWLLDEPAAGLDTAGKALLENLLDDHIGAGGQAIMALHEPLARAPSQTITLP
jgi:heme exporter protein A